MGPTEENVGLGFHLPPDGSQQVEIQYCIAQSKQQIRLQGNYIAFITHGGMGNLRKYLQPKDIASLSAYELSGYRLER